MCPWYIHICTYCCPLLISCSKTCANARTKQSLTSRAACTITPKWNAVICATHASLTATYKMPAVQKVNRHCLLLRPCFTELLPIMKLHLGLLYHPFLYHNSDSLSYQLHSMFLMYIFEHLCYGCVSVFVTSFLLTTHDIFLQSMQKRWEIKKLWDPVW